MSGITPQSSTIAQDLMEEDLARELARHETANRIALEKEDEAKAAKARALESQRTMTTMMAKYEEMKAKLDAGRQQLEETTNKISHQAILTEKITEMKSRVEAYCNKKEGVAALTEAVRVKAASHQGRLESVQEGDGEDEGMLQVRDRVCEDKERVAIMTANLRKNHETEVKREQIKVMLERQVELKEKRTEEQNHIALAREKLLELKLKELELQKIRLERKKREQEQKEKATNDFMTNMETKLENMENAIEKQGAIAKEAKESRCTSAKLDEVKEEKNKEEGEEKEKKDEDSLEKDQLEVAHAKCERRQAILDKLELIEKESTDTDEQKVEQMSEEEVKAMVNRVEVKCESVRGNMADMAVSEQYLRTKQAMLLAKKKEQEMDSAVKIAEMREVEVQKMREKVAQMKELLANKKAKVKITEEIMDEKIERKKDIEKNISRMKRRENHVEKEIIERVMFEKKEPNKKK